MNIRELYVNLHKEEPILRAEIQSLYTKLDKRFNLRGSYLPIVFGHDEKALGAYIPMDYDNEEHFEFSLVFIGFCLKNQISAADRLNLYKHEYAHYMAHHISIPKEYTWQPGIHGSAWRYCCSLIGAIPSALFVEGETLKRINYDEKLTRPQVNHATVRTVDTYRQNVKYRADEMSKVVYSIGDKVAHPKFGQGVIEKIESSSSFVRLSIRFGNDVKIIDQKWMIKSGYKKVSER